MPEAKTQADNYVKLTTVSSKPGNQKSTMYIHAKTITGWGTCPDEFISIGASTCLYDTQGGMYMVTETIDEVLELLRGIPNVHPN